MEKTILLKRQAVVDIYMYTEQLYKREVLTEPDRISMNNMHKMPLLDFDVNDLMGKEIVSAKLQMVCINDNPPFAVDITTISQQWNEKYASYYVYDKSKPWAHNGWFSDVIMSAGYSRYFREDVDYDEATKTATINIPPEVVYAMAADQSFGFGILDAKSYGYTEPCGNGGNNMKVFSASESLGGLPKLIVEYGESCTNMPPAVNNLSALAVDAKESEHGMAIKLNWELDEDSCKCMFYNIYISDYTHQLQDMNLVEKFMTPNMKSRFCGTVIDGLQADKTYYIAIEVSNGIEKSRPAFASTTTLSVEKMPVINKTDVLPKTSAKDAFCASGFSVGIVDDIAKINPQDGSAYVFGESDPWVSGIFNGKSISLLCTKGEKTAFQLSVATKNSADFTIAASSPVSMKFYKVWCIPVDGKWYPEVTIPIEDSKFSIPWAENKIPNQKQLSVLVELDVCEYQKAGTYSFDIKVKSCAGDEIIIPVSLEIADICPPRSEDFFLLELNGYVYLPKCAGYAIDDPRCKDVEREYARVAYDHYATTNILPYSHSGSIQPGDFAPEIGMVSGQMRVTDWSKWDAHFEEYLNGSYIEEVAGKRVPVTHLYLPFNESWPMNIHDYYKVKVTTDAYPDCVNEHMKLCGNIYDDFKTGYREGIKSVMKDFIWHYEEKGWHNVEFQYFFNNKHFYKQKGIHDNFPFGEGLAWWLATETTPNDGSASSWWLLDEPHYRVDWEAIEFYATILREAQSETNGGKMIKFRADLSCFNHAFDFLDGLLDTNVTGGTFARYREDILRKRKRVFGEEYWPYGGWRGIGDDNGDGVIWILDTYLQGSRGLVPWYNFALDINYEEADNCAILYPAKRFGKDTAYVSMRLKAGRKALELVKLLEAFKKAFGYSDKQLRHYVTSFVSLSGKNVFTHTADAGTTVYAKTQNALEEMKRDLIRKLEIR